ncbi:MAG TPA: thiolase family protein [Syntrophales bacterium]|nr:thiolase family protein [Syntrophales bacterium]HQB29152.1 thiolase family protein [Syntrophales bacterium]HQN77139.1 thiolase family protein [Syntrophales bacterium]HQQ25994.1 thiolase family protein [Syntrophales bacterium]
MEKAAIVGVGQTKYERRKSGEIYYDLVYEVTTRAMEDAGYTLDDIGDVITVSNDFWDGRTISCMAVQEAAGAHDKNVSTVEGDGTLGALYGLMRVLGGSGTTLIVAHSKGSEGDPRVITNAMFDPVYHRSLGLDAVSSSALQASAYMSRYGVTEEQCALVSVKNHGNAKNNPFAQLPMDITVADVMKSRKIADPLKRLDCSPVSDGAAAIIIADEKHARKARKKPVWIKGAAHCADAYFLGDRNLAEAASLREAAKKAYAMAGIGNPAKEIDVAELYDAFGFMELMWLEGLGFCDPGGGAGMTESGKTAMGGPIPVNPSGGVLSAHAVLAAGLARIAEAVLQVRGEAGPRQVDGARTSLAHGINGPCGQSHCVWILGKD